MAATSDIILSVSMIVKNEEKWLPRILEDCSHFADEIVVCDTGSTDRTLEIIESSGAKLVKFDWNNNFSAARNASLAACNGKYIMWVDADDRIVKSQQFKMRQIKRDWLGSFMWLCPKCGYLQHTAPKIMGEALCWHCLSWHSVSDLEEVTRGFLINMVSDNGKRKGMMEQLRIFPKISDDMWSGYVHESPFEALSRAGIGLLMANAYVYHYGYIDPDVLDHKIRRNMELLKKDIEATSNPVKMSYYAASLFNMGSYEESIDWFCKIFDQEKENPRLSKHDGQNFLNHLRMFGPLLKTDQHMAAFGAMEVARKIFPDDPQPYAAMAVLARLHGKVALARELAAESLKRDHAAEAGLEVLGEVHDKMRMLLEETQKYVDGTEVGATAGLYPLPGSGQGEIFDRSERGGGVPVMEGNCV